MSIPDIQLSHNFSESVPVAFSVASIPKYRNTGVYYPMNCVCQLHIPEIVTETNRVPAYRSYIPTPQCGPSQSTVTGSILSYKGDSLAKLVFQQYTPCKRILSKDEKASNAPAGWMGTLMAIASCLVGTFIDSRGEYVVFSTFTSFVQIFISLPI